MRNAAKQAASDFKTSCPSANAFPLTPPGRLGAMTARLDATVRAVQDVRPALEAFYNSLSDEQKERFNEIGPKGQKSAEAQQALPADNKACAEAKPGLTNLPIEQIEASVKPTDAQEETFKRLGDATVKAVSILQAACPEETPLTPPGRLAAMETRLKAMIEAANTVKPALEEFYGSLSNEQKARFNRIGKEVASRS
jgi:ribosomal protein L20A (L18A)